MNKHGAPKYCRVVLKPNQRGPAAMEGLFVQISQEGEIRIFITDRTVAGVHLKSCFINIPRENYSYYIVSDEPISISKVDP